ncbi:MAG: ribosome small subunit-dependent GTPase A [Acidobacteria bacterium]|nr:ribosome small subunit-dependent GTPase A [Acidobacteriota bacterium]
MAELVEGTVIATHGPLVRVQVEGQTLVVAARRRLQWEGGMPEVPRLVVGDRVTIEMRRGEGVIKGVRQRQTALYRRAGRERRAQVLAANVDQALIVFACQRPEPKRGLIDRFLVACHHADIDPVLIFNKADLGLDTIGPWIDVYRALGHAVILTSARTGRGLGEVKRTLLGRTTLFCGPSGVGKSSLLNAVYPGFRLRVGSISEATGKGRHTTSRAELQPLPGGGFVVDTPGLKEFGFWNLTLEDLKAAFPEIAERANACRFQDCTHLHEPDCAVGDAVRAGEIDAERFRSYQVLAAGILNPDDS